MTDIKADQIKAQFKKFLIVKGGDVSEVTPALTEKVISQFGGVDYFLKNYAAVVENGMTGRVGRFKKKADTVAFFNDNFKEIQASLMAMAQNYGVCSGIALLIDNNQPNLKINGDDIAQGFFADLVSIEDSTDNRIKVCHWVSHLIAANVCQAFDDFMHEVGTW